MRLCDFEVGEKEPFLLIAGPCVIESEALILETAATLKDLRRFEEVKSLLRNVTPNP